MRYLAIDLGDKRTGLAIGDTEMRIASPLTVVEIPREREDGQALLRELARLIDDHLGPADRRSAGELVVGLPLNMDGTEGPRAKIARDFAAKLAAVANRPVHLHDERLTTDAAHKKMARTGLTHGQKKARRDAIAAAMLLENFFRTQSGEHPS